MGKTAARLSISENLGCKELTATELGRNPLSNQTHIGLLEDVLPGWEQADVKVALLVQECRDSEEVTAPIGPIRRSGGSMASPKLRKGQPGADVAADGRRRPFALDRIQKMLASSDAHLIFGTVDHDRVLLLLMPSGGRWENAMTRELGGLPIRRLEAGTARHARVAQLVQGFLEENAVTVDSGGKNIIYFGPPGTGKSYAVKQRTACSRTFRTVFHPEYTYSDFVGTYKPVVGSVPDDSVIGFDGEIIDRPVNYFAFEPGVLTRALVAALWEPDESVALIIEEINRGDCAAIFGDFFQLLDRDEVGRSEYPVQVTGALQQYLRNEQVLGEEDHEVAFPAKLSLFATMNTSDQALFPMDAAFKRRWQWKAVPISYEVESLAPATVEGVGGTPDIRWLEFIERLNERILIHTRNEDRRIGPWYIRPEQDRIPVAEIREKLLFYLWHDVFRDRPEQLFDPDIKSFDHLQTRFDSGGLYAVFPWMAVDSSEEVPDSDSTSTNDATEAEYDEAPVVMPRAAETELDDRKYETRSNDGGDWP